MRIISKFDYYDSVQGYGFDPTVIITNSHFLLDKREKVFYEEAIALLLVMPL